MPDYHSFVLSAQWGWSRRNYDFRHLAAAKVLESQGGGVIALDDHDRLVSYNRAAANIFTHLPDHKLGENIWVVEDFREEMLKQGHSPEFFYQRTAL